MYEIEEYVAEDGASPFAEWLEGLKDARARMRILTRLDRASLGNLGDWTALSNAEGVAELRDHYGQATACTSVSLAAGTFCF